jgi:hypothetical protein
MDSNLKYIYVFKFLNRYSAYLVVLVFILWEFLTKWKKNAFCGKQFSSRVVLLFEDRYLVWRPYFVCVCVCVYDRERERHRGGERETFGINILRNWWTFMEISGNIMVSFAVLSTTRCTSQFTAISDVCVTVADERAVQLVCALIEHTRRLTLSLRRCLYKTEKRNAAIAARNIWPAVVFDAVKTSNANMTHSNMKITYRTNKYFCDVSLEKDYVHCRTLYLLVNHVQPDDGVVNSEACSCWFAITNTCCVPRHLLVP